MKKIIIIFLFVLCPVFIFAADKIDINTSSLSQLDEIIGIGPALGQRIIDTRPFSSVDDLLRVKGIGEKTLQKIKDQGLACVNCATQINSETQNTKSETNYNSQNLNAQNSPTPSPAVAVAPSSSPTPQTTYPTGVFINEILPNPEGADETEEWIELYNSNSFDIDLSGWKISDTIGTITNYAFSKDIKILANGFLLLKRPDTKIMLNNDQDGINILTPDGKIVDSATYLSAPLGQSYNKNGSKWQWSQKLTPDKTNVIFTESKTLPKSKKSDNSKIVDAGLADISQSIDLSQEDKLSNPWFLFFTALAITIISASIVLLIKLNFFKKSNERT